MKKPDFCQLLPLDLFVIIIFSLFSTSALADCTTTGMDDRWSRDNSWDCGKKPECTDTKITVDHPLKMDEIFNCPKSDPITLTLNADLNFQGLSKIILPSGSTIIIAPGVSIKGGNNNALVVIGGTSVSGPFNYTNDTGGYISLDEANLISALPVELVEFTATPSTEGRYVLIRWVTQNETNNDYFTLERSPDIRDWEPIGEKIPGTINSTQPVEYKYVDHAPLGGVFYYRLKQTDLDGTSTYTRYIPVEIEEKPNNFDIFYQPADQEVKVHFFGHTEAVGEVSLYNIMGLPVHITPATALTSVSFSMNGFPSGGYIIMVRFSNNRVRSKHFVHTAR